MKFKRPLVLVLVLALAMSAVTGGTIAWFTDEVTSAANVISSGTLDAKVYSSDDGANWIEVKDGSDPLFNYGLWEPGYTTYKFIKIENAGNLAFKFQLNVKADSGVTGKYKLADVIDVYTGTDVPTRDNLGTKVGTLSSLMNDVDGAAYGVLEAGKSTGLCLTLKMQESAGNEYQNLSIGEGFSLQVLATQATVESDSFGNDYDANATYGVDIWNGNVETNLPTIEGENGENYILITTAEELAGLAANVNSGAESYKNKIIKLGNNIDLANRNWTPVGTTQHDHDAMKWFPGKAFEGTFDGQDYTISNLSINNVELDGAGLFGYTKGATIKNINVKNVDIDADCGTAAIVAYSGPNGTKPTTIENCHVSGKIEIINEWAYVAGIFGYGPANIEKCSVVADGIGVIASKGRNAIGGISAWFLDDNSSVNKCTVKNIDMSGYANVASISGYVAPNNRIMECTAENINLTKTRTDGHPSIGLASGGWSYNANKAITITDNSFKNITLNGTVIDVVSANIMYGSEFAGNLNSNFVLTNNTQEGIKNNLKKITKEDIITISTVDGLKELAVNVNNGNNYQGKVIVLDADLDLKNQEWAPIGTSDTPFKGIFDGKNHTIKNLVVNGGNNSNQGLFGDTRDGEIKNLVVENAKVSGYLNVAVVAGQPYTSKYTNITVKGHVEVNGYAYVGGVGGKNAYADWTNITVKVDNTSYVKAESENYRTYVGGVVGFMGEGGHTMKNITSNIDVIGSTCDVGGIVGIAHYNNKFINANCSGDVTITSAQDVGDDEEIGGIAGVWHNENGTTVTFENCSFTGKLSSNRGADLSNNTIVGKSYSTDGTGTLVIK